MPFGGGRCRAQEWQEVNEVVNDANKVSCKYCKHIISAKIERIKNHLKKCAAKNKRNPTLSNLNTESSLSNVYVNIEDDEIIDLHMQSKQQCNLSRDFSSTSTSMRSMSSLSTGTDDISKLENSLTISGPSCSSTPFKSEFKRQKTMKSYAVTTSATEKTFIDIKLARYFFSTNTPFTSVENNEFIEFVQALRPGYNPPNRKALGNELLEKVYDEVQTNIQLDIANNTSALILMQDGWSNTQNDPIIAHSVHTGETPYLICIDDAGSNKKTAEYCASLAEKAMKEIQETFNKQVGNFKC